MAYVEHLRKFQQTLPVTPLIPETEVTEVPLPPRPAAISWFIKIHDHILLEASRLGCALPSLLLHPLLHGCVVVADSSSGSASSFLTESFAPGAGGEVLSPRPQDTVELGPQPHI